jgi:chemotaxis protein MotB
MRALAAALALLATACVSQETYRRKEAEAARLERDWKDESERRSALELRVKDLQRSWTGSSRR